jgi:hypothetical protein
MQAVQRSRRSAIRSSRAAEVGRTAESGWVEEGQCTEIDHVLQKRHSESQSAGDDFGARRGDGGNGGALLGLAPKVGLSISLIKCIRKIALGVPMLLVWQAVEGRRFLGTATRGEA